jgi:SRSO17 transposase
MKPAFSRKVDVQRHGRAHRERPDRRLSGLCQYPGRVLLDRELYLPKAWAQDKARRQAVKVPEEVEFATKPQQAQRLIERAVASAVAGNSPV